MTNKDYIVFGKPSFTEEEIEAVAATLRSGWAGTGARVQEFQRAFAAYVGTRHAVAVGSCTAALHLALVAAGLGEGDEVITTPLTFAATANAIVHSGATPVFADIRRDSMNIDPEQVEERISPRTRAILPVHLAGRPCEMDSLRTIAHRYGLMLIEDAAHAVESRYRGGKIGALGDASCFSFYVTKNMTTIEGGMLCTDQDYIANKARVLSLHGMSADAWSRFSDEGYKHYDVIFTGFKYNMTDVQAAIGIRQLAKIDGWLQRRREIWARYDEAFADLPCLRPAPEEAETLHARHLYTLLVDEATAGITRDQFLQTLHRNGIGCGVHYRSLHIHPYYRKRFGFKPDDFPNAYYVGEHTASIPLSPHLTNEQVERVISVVRTTLRKGTESCVSSS
jgi:dTDP-4-amino-4,6-dideoxygalactose transaminase